MSQKGLNARLPQIKVPACVLWGASDRIVDPEYGLAYATAIPGAEFRMLPDTGHAPQLETPAPLAAAILGFTAGISAPRRSGPTGRSDGGR